MCFVHQQTISEQFLVEFSLLSGHCAFGGYWIGIFERVLCHRFGIQQILEPVNALLILKEGVRWLSVHAEDLADSRLVFFAFFWHDIKQKTCKKHTFGCLLYIFLLLIFGCTTYIQSYKVTSWGVNIFCVDPLLLFVGKSWRELPSQSLNLCPTDSKTTTMMMMKKL